MIKFIGNFNVVSVNTRGIKTSPGDSKQLVLVMES